VRFRQPGQVMQASVNILTKALAKKRPPASPAPWPSKDYPPADSSFYQPSVAEHLGWSEGADRAAEVSDYQALNMAVPKPVETPEYDQGGLKAIGALFNTYILAQGPDGLYIVDQHAAHERVLFERLKTEMSDGPLNGQRLLMPLTIEVSPTQAAALEGMLEVLSRFGFELEPFGGQTFVLKAVPAILTGRDPYKIMEEIIDETNTLRPDAGLARIEESFMQTICCHGSIRAGDALTLEEMNRLLADLDQTEISTHCPHGRPLIYLLDLKEIEKKFKRA
ncbi:MAG: hypothetical protein JRI34_01440, partial [Deltaproteobacteria bacterium]|nr:hypothetical protein [Deltaproteobacteria bacterium]